MPVAKVLIGDHDQLTIDRISAVLIPLGHECIQATDGLEAIQTYSREQPDAVFLDIAMPLMDGISALRAIRAADPPARVTIVTAVGHYVQVKDALSAGAVDFVVKPFNNQRLLVALTRMLD